MNAAAQPSQPAVTPPAAASGPALREPGPFSSEPKRLTVSELWARASDLDELLGDIQALEEHYEKAARDAALACERFKLEAQRATRMLQAVRRRSVDLCRHLDQMASDGLARAASKAAKS